MSDEKSNKVSFNPSIISGVISLIVVIGLGAIAYNKIEYVAQRQDKKVNVQNGILRQQYEQDINILTLEKDLEKETELREKDNEIHDLKLELEILKLKTNGTGTN